jgi:hypothetical protein
VAAEPLVANEGVDRSPLGRPEADVDEGGEFARRAPARGPQFAPDRHPGPGQSAEPGVQVPAPRPGVVPEVAALADQP